MHNQISLTHTKEHSALHHLRGVKHNPVPYHIEVGCVTTSPMNSSDFFNLGKIRVPSFVAKDLKPVTFADMK